MPRKTRLQESRGGEDSRGRVHARTQKSPRYKSISLYTLSKKPRCGGGPGNELISRSCASEREAREEDARLNNATFFPAGDAPKIKNESGGEGTERQMWEEEKDEFISKRARAAPLLSIAANGLRDVTSRRDGVTIRAAPEERAAFTKYSRFDDTTRISMVQNRMRIFI